MQLILNKDFNDVSNGSITPYKKGDNVSHLPDEVIEKLKADGHINGFEPEDKDAPVKVFVGDEELQAKVKELEDQVKAGDTELEKATGIITELNATIETGKNQVDELLNRVNELESENIAFKDQVAANDAEIIDLKAKLVKKK